MEYDGKYSTVFGGPKWWAFDNRLSVKRSMSARVDVSLSALRSYTVQTEAYSTLEWRPTLGVRYHITPHRRILSRVLLRYELRLLKDLTNDDWTRTNRLRIRPELLIPINRESLYADGLWYGIVDAEWFATLDEDQEERFANRLRTRLGMGYRFNYTSRIEVIQLLQRSRNTLEEEFTYSDYIIQIRWKHYLRKSKPIKNTLDGAH
jgi:hypothetical protein